MSQAASVSTPPHHAQSLAHLPLPLFAAPMGLGGLALAWREASSVLGAPREIGEALMALTAVIWLLVAGFHLIRLMRHPESFKADLRHPVRAAFVGAITIGMMLISGGLIPYSMTAAQTVWIVAVAVHILVGVWTVRTLIKAPREASALTPPLLIPMVGNIIAPVFGIKLGFPELSWALFGIGALLWVIVQPLLLWRVTVGAPLPERLRPTLVIFLAPPAVGSIALANLMGGTNPASLAVLGFATFIAFVLLSMLRDFAKVPFAMSWWGWTFPTASFAIALLRTAHDLHAPWMNLPLWSALLAASAILAVVVGGTLKALFQGHLLLPEG